MKIQTVEVAQAIAADLETVIQKVLAKNNLQESKLYKSMVIETRQTDKSVVTEVYLANYIHYLERGRKPMEGKQPPVDALRDWAMERNIPTDNSTLFAIANAIRRDGYEGRPLLAEIAEEADRKWETEWCHMLFDAVSEQLTAYGD